MLRYSRIRIIARLYCICNNCLKQTKLEANNHSTAKFKSKFLLTILFFWIIDLRYITYIRKKMSFLFSNLLFSPNCPHFDCFLLGPQIQILFLN
jgi:hypothetical protein